MHVVVCLVIFLRYLFLKYLITAAYFWRTGLDEGKLLGRGGIVESGLGSRPHTL